MCSKILPDKKNPNNHQGKTTHCPHTGWHWELTEQDQDMNYTVMSDPDLIICNREGLKGSTSALIPKLDNRKALTLPSMLAVPPPLPLKRYQRSSAFEKTLSQDPQLKSFSTENEPLNSLACHTCPALGGVKQNSQRLDIIPGKAPGLHNSCRFGTLPNVEPKCQTQFSPRPPLKAPIKPPRLNRPVRAETEEGKQQETDWRRLKERLGDKKDKQGQDSAEKNETTENNKETFQIESHLDMGKPPRQIIVLFTDMMNGGDEGEDRGKRDEGPSNIWLTTPTMTENSALQAMKRSDLTPGEEPDIAVTNINCTSIVSSKPELTTPPQLPPKKHRKCPPIPPIKPPQLFSAMRSRIEVEKEKRNEEGRDKGLVDKEKDENEGEGKEGGKVNGDTESTSPTLTVNQEVELPRGGQRFCLKPPCRKRPTLVTTAENETLQHESQNPGTQHQDKTNEHVQSVPPPQKSSTQVNSTGTDSSMETLKRTDNNKEILQEVQDSERVSGLSFGPLEGTGVAQEIAETLLDGQLKQTSQKSSARGKVKLLAKKMMGRWKEGRDEKRRVKALEMEMDGEVSVEMTQDESRDGEDGGLKDEETEKGMDEVAVDQSAVTETQSHADLMESRIKRRSATSESLFSSFQVCSQVKLVQELLSGDDWTQFLDSSKHDPPLCQTHSEDTGQPGVDFWFNSSAEPDLARDVFEGSPVVTEESIYEDIDLTNLTPEQQEMNRAHTAAVPQIILESDTNPMTPRTKDIYDTVEFIQTVQPANTHKDFSDIKSQVVLDSAVQKYLIKLSKKRKHRAKRKQHRPKSQETRGLSPSITSPQQVFTASVFYSVPASGGEEQLSAVKSGGSSPRSLAKIKTPLKDKTMLKAAQPKEDRKK